MCGRCTPREQSAHVGASPPNSRSMGCGGEGTPPKGLWAPAEPPTPCVPRAYADSAVFFSALHPTVRPTPAGGEAFVRTRCWGPRRAGAGLLNRPFRCHWPLVKMASACWQCLSAALKALSASVRYLLRSPGDHTDFFDVTFFISACLFR
jgi:hypothetical protein